MVTGTLIIFYLAGGGVSTCEGLPFTEEDLSQYFDRSACLDGDSSAVGDWEKYSDDRFVYAQTMTFAVFVVFQLFNVMNCRSSEDSIFKLGLFSNKAINYAVLISLTLLWLIINNSSEVIPILDIRVGSLLSTIKLEAKDWLIIMAVASGVFIVEEFRKFIIYSKFFAIGKNKQYTK
jgi:Ca2+-transporting ATPase